MNISRIAIIRGVNPETNKREIERVVVFYENGQVENFEYNREEHLRLVANFLESNGLDILNDGLREGMRAGLVSLVSRDDEIAMANLKNSIIESQLNEASEERQEEISEEREEEPRQTGLSDEFKDLARYFRLSILREQGVLPPVGEREIAEIVARNERAEAVEAAREQYLAGKLSMENYREVYAVQRRALAEAIKQSAIERENERAQEEATNENAQEEREETREENRETISDEFKDLARYLRLNMLRDQKVLPPVGEREIAEIVARNERAQAIEETRNQYVNQNISEESYRRVLEAQRAALAEEIKRVALLNSERENAQQVAENNNENNNENAREELSDEYKELVKYLRLNILRNRGVLPPKGLEEIERLARQNERVAAIEETRNQLLAGNISEEDYERELASHRQALADEVRRLAEVNRNRGNAEEPAEAEREVTPVVPVTPVDNRENDNENVEDPNLTNNIDDYQGVDNTNNEPVEDPNNTNVINVDGVDNNRDDFDPDDFINRIHTNGGEFNNENNDDLDDFGNNGPTPPGGGNPPTPPSDGNDGNDGPTPPGGGNPPTPPGGGNPPTPPNDGNDGNDGNNGNNGDNDDRDNDNDTPNLPIVINRNGPDGDRVVGTIPDDPNDPENTDEVVEVPTINPDGTANSEETRPQRVRRRNRVWAAILAALIGLPLIGVLIDRLVNRDKNKQADPAGPTPPPQTQDDTVNQGINIENEIINYSNEYNLPQETVTFLMRGDVRNFLNGFKDPAQLKEVISALAFGFEMNALCTKDGNLRTAADGQNILKSFTYDFMCAKAVVNGYTPEQMAKAFGSTTMTYERLMDGFHGFYNMLTVYGLEATEMPPFRYLTNGETKDTKALTQLFSALATVNANRKANTLSSVHTDDFIVQVDKLYGRGQGTQFTTEGAATLGMALVDAYCYAQANVGYGAALTLQDDHGVSKAGLTLGADETGHWEIDGFNYLDLFTQANRRWGNEADYNSRCYQYQQRLSASLEAARTLVSGDTVESRLDFAQELDQYDELKPYAEQVRRGTLSADALRQIGALVANYPQLATAYNTYMAAEQTAHRSSDLVGIDEYAPKVDAFLGVGLRDDYQFEEVMNYYVNKVYSAGERVRFVDENGKVIGPTRDTGRRQQPDQGDRTRPDPTARPPKVETTTTVVPVKPEDLTPEEQEQAQEQIEHHQEEEDQEFQEQIDHAQEVADDVTEQLHQGTITDEQAQQQLEDAGVTVDPGYLQRMEEIRRQEEEARRQAEQAAEEANRREQEEREERRRQEEEAERRRREEEEALISGQTPAQQQPAPEPEQQPQPEPQPEQQPATPVDPELDTTHTEEDEMPYTGNRSIQDLQELRALAASLDDFGVEEPTNGRTLSI